MTSHEQLALHVGVVGYGTIGKWHARLLEEHPAVAMISVLDPHLESVEARLLRSPKYAGFSSSFDLNCLPNLDAVVIATPTGDHLEAARHFAGKNVPMLIEKPLALSYMQAQEVLQAASDVPAMCGLTGLWHPEFMAMYAALDRIGPLQSVKEHVHEANPELARFLDVGRGVLCTNGIHSLHRFSHIAERTGGEQLTVVNARLGHHYFSRMGDDTAFVGLQSGSIPYALSLSFRDGRRCDNGFPIDYKLTVEGAHGTLHVLGYESCTLEFPDESSELLYAHPDGPLGCGNHYLRIAIGLRRELDDFLQFAALRRVSGNNHPTLSQALEGQRLVEESYAVGRVARLRLEEQLAREDELF